MGGLLTELAELSNRNDELMHAKDSDLIIIRDLDAQMKEYKRKYEQAKTELRSVKGALMHTPASFVSDIFVQQLHSYSCKHQKWTTNCQYQQKAAYSISTSRHSFPPPTRS